MSRALRRMQERVVRRNHKPNRSEARYVTKFQLEHESFDTIERMFQKIRNGELEYEGPHPIIMGLHGEHYRMLPALDGWLKYWRDLTAQQSIPYDDGALLRLRNSLDYGKPLTEGQVDEAYAVVTEQRRLYRLLPKAVTTKVAHAVMREIALDDQIKDAMRAAA